MPGFPEGLNVSYENRKRVETSSKGYTLNNRKDGLVIYNDGRYCVGDDEFGFGSVHLEMQCRYGRGDVRYMGGHRSLEFSSKSWAG